MFRFENPVLRCRAITLVTGMFLFLTAPLTVAQETTTDDPPKTDGSRIEFSLDGAKSDPGQEDLDEAAILRFDAKSARELQAVERLLQSAMKKGLTGENASFAKKMLGSVLLQKAQQLIQSIRNAPPNQALQIRDEALRVLDEAVANDKGLVEGYLLVARLNMLPGGDREAITEATTSAIEILEDDPEERSAALVLRALTWGPGNEEKRLDDLNAAIKDDPKNLEALRARAAIRLQEKDVSGAIEDMEKVLEQDPTNQQVAQTIVQELTDLDRVDEAMRLLSKALETKPSEGLYRLRAILNRMQGNEETALADLNKALAMQPRDAISLLQRAEISIGRKNIQAAKDDLRAAEMISPAVAAAEQAIFVRCLIAIEEGRMADAINEMKTLIERDPSNMARQLQLANLYLEDKRPRKAIELLSAILVRDPSNVSVLRSRADAFLSVGDHQKAIDDYELAIKKADELGDDASDMLRFDMSGVLNNLAWVLATSPNENVRDGKRSVELGERAVELTEGEEPHILSTLAAGYAEVGNFEKAIEWSEKAVELGKEQGHNQIEQLEEELDSYREKKPWREKQETEENAVPILSPEDLIDT